LPYPTLFRSIGGGGAVIINGGQLTLTNNHFNTGPTTISNGMLIVTGSMVAGATVNAGTYPTSGLIVRGTIQGAVVVNSGGYLYGSYDSLGVVKGQGYLGCCLTVNSGGTVLLNNPLIVASIVTFNPGSFFIVYPSTTGTYDGGKITSSGLVDLTSATLQVPEWYDDIGVSKVIIQAASIINRFNGLPEAATLGFDGGTLRINYTTTTVTLTRIA
jgi:hypothetical protein